MDNPIRYSTLVKFGLHEMDQQYSPPKTIVSLRLSTAVKYLLYMCIYF